MKLSFTKRLSQTSSNKGQVVSGDQSRLAIWGFCSSSGGIRLVVVSFFELLTCGLLTLIFYWKPEWRVLVSKRACALEQADTVLIRDESRQYYVRPVKSKSSKDGFLTLKKSGVKKIVKSFRYFTHRKTTYTWEEEANSFHRLADLSSQFPLVFFGNWSGWTDEEAERVAEMYGPNEIIVPMKSIAELVFREALNPFYIFQVFSVCIWFSDVYYWYASVIIIMSVLSITMDVYQTRKNQAALRDSMHSIEAVTVVRGGVSQMWPSTELVPGDVLVIPSGGCTIQCDSVLLSGNCIVNESTLTGESVPVTKTPLVISKESTGAIDGYQLYDSKLHAKHTLFCGTTVLQTRFYSGQEVRAIVLRTGFSTSKGQLVRSIMYPKPVDFEFTKDLFRFVAVLALVAGLGFVYTVVLMSMRGNDIWRILVRALDLITICVPPALPAAMTIGIIAAQSRLKKRDIYCICPSVINTCGAIDVVCFDKTGTLTEEGLNLHGIVQMNMRSLGGSTNNLNEVEPEVVRAMACCHSLTRVEGEVVGDPMDLILFQHTGWEIKEPEVVEESGRYDLIPPTVVSSKRLKVEIGVLRLFVFTSALQRMSVIVRQLGSSEFILYCKGAPETVVSLCDKESVPSNFASVLHSYTRRGFRVLAFASKRLEMSFVKVQRSGRAEVEQNLQFLALVVFENRLKDETSPAVYSLYSANIRSIMVTGDNIMTAISVARQCFILDSGIPLYLVKTKQANDDVQLYFEKEESYMDDSSENSFIADRPDTVLDFSLTKSLSRAYQFAMDGPTFAVLTKKFPQFVSKVALMCNVFARMSPDQKTQLVHVLQEMDYVVAMCGDGANDCGALKAAHAGISLSEAEASIASPFTSKCADVRCVGTVILEGRAALTTSFGVFKYMAGYSLIQFLSVLLLYWIGTNLADFQFLFIDLVLITLSAVFFGQTPAADSISVEAPPSRILSVSSICSIALQLILAGVFQVFAFLFVTQQPWFVAFPFPSDEQNYDSYQVTVVFLTSTFQYVVIAVVYSKSYPYRKTIFHNHWFFVSTVFCTLTCLWITLYPPAFLATLLQLKMPPFTKYRGLIVLLAALHAVVAYSAETYIVDWLVPKFFERACVTKRIPRYMKVLEQVARSPSWCTASSYEETAKYVASKMNDSVVPLTV